ncbi:MAG TPA: Hpt domain-containing protein [Candidatus Acidoferrum sp.]|nr:Hpt domain-containing protein [Candidatus Acidoferrum sp.]
MNSFDRGVSASAADAPPRPDTRPIASREPSEPVLDFQVLEELRALQARGKSDILQRVLCVFTGHAPGVLAALREAGDRQDCQGVASAAHSLKSSSGNLGAVRLADVCARLERLARRGSLDGMGELLAAAESEYRSASAALADYAGTP